MAAHLEDHPEGARGGQPGAGAARPARGLRRAVRQPGELRDPLLRLLTREDLDRLSAAGARADARSVLPRQPHQDDRAVSAPTSACAICIEFARAHGGDADALSVRAVLRRSAHLVSPVLDRRDRAPRARSRGAADEPRRRLQPRATAWSCSQLIGARDAATISRALPQAGRVGAASSCRPRRTTIRSARCCSTSPARAKRCRRRRCPRRECYPGGRSRARLAPRVRAADSHRPPLRMPCRRASGRPRARVSTPFLHACWPSTACAGPPAARACWPTRCARAGLPSDDRDGISVPPLPRGVEATGITCFFRDDRLSDLIGFEYKGWHGADAAQSLHRAARADPRAPRRRARRRW